MKKLLFFWSLVLFSLCTISCQQQEETLNSDNVSQTVQVDSAMQSFMQQVQTLDANYGFIPDEHVTRISFGRLFKLIVSAVISDAVGAGFGAMIGAGYGNPVIGAAVGGVGASIYTVCNQDRIPDVQLSRTRSNPLWLIGNNTPGEACLDSLIFKDGVNASKMDSLGYYHNYVIRQMTLNDTTYMSSSTYLRPDLLDSIYGYHVRYLSLPQLNAIQGTDMKSTIDAEIKTFIEYCIEEDDFFSCPIFGFWKGKEDLYSLITSYAQNLCSGGDMSVLYNYTADYLDLLEASNMTDSQKEMLSSAVVVGFASRKYWVLSY